MIHEGECICILAVGTMVEVALEISKYILYEFGIKISVINCRFIKPIDYNLIDILIENHDNFITMEEGILSGGFGSIILEYFSHKSIMKNVKLFGINDEYSEHGSRTELLKDIGLNKESIIIFIKSIINEKKPA